MPFPNPGVGLTVLTNKNTLPHKKGGKKEKKKQKKRKKDFKTNKKNHSADQLY